jgi:antitoxin component YwqK of YwqJK toxin-antitoxin module
MQTNLFENTENIASHQYCEKNSHFLQTHKWQEFHENGKLWIDGEIAVISEKYKDLYDFRTEVKGFEGKPVVRIGIWSKYFDNGQIEWKNDRGDGSYKTLFSDKRIGNKFPSFQKDGTPKTQ